MSFLSQVATFFSTRSNWSRLERDRGLVPGTGETISGGGAGRHRRRGGCRVSSGPQRQGELCRGERCQRGARRPLVRPADPDRHPARHGAAPGGRVHYGGHHDVRPGRAAHTHQRLCRRPGHRPRRPLGRPGHGYDPGPAPAPGRTALGLAPGHGRHPDGGRRGGGDSHSGGLCRRQRLGDLHLHRAGHAQQRGDLQRGVAGGRPGPGGRPRPGRGSTRPDACRVARPVMVLATRRPH